MSHFDGADYVHAEDYSRLKSQYDRVFALMRDGQWRTLEGISELTGDPVASVSAQLRHMRKPRFGAHTVERRYMDRGLYVYRVIENTSAREYAQATAVRA